MARSRSLMLKIGVLFAVVGCILIAKPFETEPLWLQWVVGFGLFYVGVPIAIVGAAIHFIGYNSGPRDPFARPRNRSQKGTPAA